MKERASLTIYLGKYGGRITRITTGWGINQSTEENILDRK